MLQVSVDFIRLKSYENDQSLGEIKIIGLEVCCFNVTISRVIIIIIIIISISITIISVQSLDVTIIYWSPDSRFNPVCTFVDEKLDVSTHLHNLLHLVAVPRLCCIYSQNVMHILAKRNVLVRAFVASTLKTGYFCQQVDEIPQTHP